MEFQGFVKGTIKIERVASMSEGGTGRSMMMDVDKVKRTLTLEQIGKDFPLQ